MVSKSFFLLLSYRPQSQHLVLLIKVLSTNSAAAREVGERDCELVEGITDRAAPQVCVLSAKKKKRKQSVFRVDLLIGSHPGPKVFNILYQHNCRKTGAGATFTCVLSKGLKKKKKKSQNNCASSVCEIKKI